MFLVSELPIFQNLASKIKGGAGQRGYMFWSGTLDFGVRRLTSALETCCVARSARKRSPIMRIHTTELLLKF